MEEGKREGSPEGATKYFRLSIMRIQSAIARTPTTQKLLTRTPTGVTALEKPVVSKLIDLAYVERTQVITDKLVLQESDGVIIVRHERVPRFSRVVTK
jgi:hypothetical protein